MKYLQTIRLVVQLAIFAFGFTAFFQTNYLSFYSGFLVLAVVIGAFYCGWACPFGMVQDVFGKIGSIFLRKKLTVPYRFQKYLFFLRYVLAILFLILAAKQIFVFANYDARIIFFSALALTLTKITAISILSFFVLISMIFDRPFCNYICPQGAKFGALSLCKVLTIQRNSKTCLQCKKCSLACPMHIPVADRKNNRSAHCINCFRCITACPHKSLHLSVFDWKHIKKFFKTGHKSK